MTFPLVRDAPDIRRDCGRVVDRAPVPVLGPVALMQGRYDGLGDAAAVERPSRAELHRPKRRGVVASSHLVMDLDG